METGPGHGNQAATLEDFLYVDTAFGGVDRRNNVRLISSVVVNGQADCYLSHNRATKDLAAWVKRHKNKDGKPSVGGFDGPTWADNLHLDIDAEGNLHLALDLLRQVLARIEVMEIDLGTVRIYFSGAKGFHVEIPHTLFGGFEPARDLHKRLKCAAQRIMGDIPYDASVYDKLRLWRIENTRHKKSGLYKVRLTTSEALTADLDDILTLAMQPRDISAIAELATIADDDEWLPVDELVGIWASTLDQGEPPEPAPRRAPSSAARDRQTIAVIAASWPLGGDNVEGASGASRVSRHTDYLLPIAGFLTRRTDAHHVHELLVAGAEQAGDATFLQGRDWRSELERIVLGASERIGRGDDVKGLPSLAQSFPALANVLAALWKGEQIGGDEVQVSGAAATGVVTAEPWPEPVRQLDLPPAPALDLGLFPPEVANVALDVADRLQCPPDYVAWGLMVSVAGLIGRGVGIRPRQRDDWTERACSWVVMIGDPSWMKSPALGAARRPLERQDAIDHKNFEANMAIWEAEFGALRPDAGKGPKSTPTPKPIEIRRATSDATIEKLADLMAPSPGMTLIRDEIAGWVGGFNRYTKAEGDRQFFLECYSGGPYTVDRISRGTVRVPDTYLNILGGAQPDRARDIFGEGPDDGFAARMTAIYPELPPTWKEVDRLPDKAARDALDAVCDRLVAANWATLLPLDEWKPLPYCRLGPDAGALWAEWHKRIMIALRSETWEGRQAGRIGKYPGLAARLVLVWHLINWGAKRVADSALARVPELTMAKVLNLMDNYVSPMDDRVYRAFDRTDAAVGAQRIAKWILKEKPTSFTLRDVRRHEWSELTEASAVAAAVEWLAAKGWVREADPEQRPGRPSNRYIINPRLWEVKK